MLQDRLEQLRAPQGIGQGQVPLGQSFRRRLGLQGGVVVELPRPLAVDVELALDPVDRLEELVPPFFFGRTKQIERERGET